MDAVGNTVADIANLLLGGLGDALGVVRQADRPGCTGGRHRRHAAGVDGRPAAPPSAGYWQQLVTVPAAARSVLGALRTALADAEPGARRRAGRRLGRRAVDAAADRPAAARSLGQRPGAEHRPGCRHQCRHAGPALHRRADALRRHARAHRPGGAQRQPAGRPWRPRSRRASAASTRRARGSNWRTVSPSVRRACRPAPGLVAAGRAGGERRAHPRSRWRPATSMLPIACR